MPAADFEHDTAVKPGDVITVINSLPAGAVPWLSWAAWDPGQPWAPLSTYRLQLRPGFGFAEAGELADYLADLGVTHVYLSPILQANPGSPHGYDVVDHSRVSADLGGEDAFRAMAERFHRHHLGVVVDIVPNHMARPTPESRNKQLWSVLYQGQASPYAHWFDVDWAAQDGKLLMPILAGPLEKCLDDLIIDTAPKTPENAEHRGPVLRYFDHVLPLRDGVADLPLGMLLAEQHYRLADWHDAATQLNWRRFFDIDTLIAIRVEDPDVFEATHRVPLRLAAEGLIDGLRVDHPDGLADPGGYLRRLADATGGMWVVVEKILARGEELPAWDCAGTTGYDALALVDGLFVDPDGAPRLTEDYVRFTGGKPDFAEVARDAKRGIADATFTAELYRLTRLFARADFPALAGLGEADLHDVLVELLAAFGVYRAYVRPGEPPPEVSVAVVSAAAAAAREALEPRLHPALDAVCAAVLGLGGVAGDEARQAARDELVVRFGQTTGPVLAKGVEDTAFYRWPRLASLNEVGGDPDIFGVSPAEFHAAAGAPRGPVAGHHDHAVHPRHQAAGGRAGPAGRARRVAGGLGAQGRRVARPGQLAHRRRGGPGHRAGPGSRPGVPDVADPGRRLAAGRRAAARVPGQGHARGQDADLLDRPRPGLRGGGARPGRRRAGRPGAGGRDRRVRGPDRAGRPGQLARRQARPAHHAGGARRLPGLRAHRPVAGGSGQPAAGRLPAAPAAAGRAAGRARRWWAWTRRSCCSPAVRWSCGATTPSGSPAATPRWPAKARPPSTRSRSCAASTRSPSSPGCPPGCGGAAAGPIPSCRCPGCTGGTC